MKKNSRIFVNRTSLKGKINNMHSNKEGALSQQSNMNSK